MERVERRIAADINRRNYQVALVYSCRITHSPSVLRHLKVRSLYYMNEPRRQSFEPGYRPAVHTPPIRRIVTSGRERVLRRQDRLAVAAADHIATNSYYSAESIERAYGRSASVCYLGIDTATFDVVAGDQPAADHPTVISVGALDPVKGHDLVVRSLGLLPAGRRPALRVVYERCDPAYRVELQALAAANGVDLQLHFGITDSKLAALYREASATVLAARLEPFGLVPLESLACGTPVVAVREGGYRETVEHEVNGFLVDRSPAEIAQAVDRVLNGGINRTADQLRSTVVPRWGWDDAAKRQLELLAMAAEKHRR
jgi:glycosyltransferase involved in cell wall biosynthesis